MIYFYLLIYLIGIFITIWIFKKFDVLDPHREDDEDIFHVGILFWPLTWIFLLFIYSMKIFVKIYDKL